MKKIKFLCMAALFGLGLASCSDDYKDWADPQSNPQGDAITIDGFSAKGVDPINMKDVTTDSVKVFTLTMGALPEGYTFNGGTLTLTPTTDGAKSTDPVTLNPTIDTTTGAATVAKADLIAAVKSIYGGAPNQRVLNGKVLLTATTPNLAGVTIDAGTVPVTVTLDAPVLAEAYYLVGTNNKWDLSDKTYQLSNGGVDPYENPIFTVTVPSVGGDNWFKIVPKTVSDANDWNADNVVGVATNGEGNASGSIVVGKNDDVAKAFCVNDKDCKFVQITVNLIDLTYTITKMNFGSYLYETGDNTKWGNGYALYGPNGDGLYYGALYLTGEFKFRDKLDTWDGLTFNLGKGATDGTLENGSNTNLKAPADGFYWVEVNAADYTYKLTPFKSIDLIGSGQPGSWTTGTEMKFNSDDHTWVIESVKLVDGEVKFRSDQSWDGVDLGGSLSALYKGGANIPVTAGTYKIVLHTENQAEKAPYAEFIKK